MYVRGFRPAQQSDEALCRQRTAQVLDVIPFPPDGPRGSTKDRGSRGSKAAPGPELPRVVVVMQRRKRPLKKPGNVSLEPDPGIRSPIAHRMWEDRTFAVEGSQQRQHHPALGMGLLAGKQLVQNDTKGKQVAGLRGLAAG